MAVILDGKKPAQEVKSELKEEVKRIKEKIGRPPKLCVILVGNDKSSEIYVRNKIRRVRRLGSGRLIKNFLQILRKGS